MTCISGPPCRPGNTAELIFLAMASSSVSTMPPRGPAQRLVGGGGDDMGVAERGRVLARRDQPGEMRHVDEQHRADLVADRAEAGEIEVARVGRAAGDDHLRPMLLGKPLDLVEIDQMVVAARTPYWIALNHLPDWAGGAPWVRCPPAARLMPMIVSPGFKQRHHHRAIGLRARVRLDVGEAAAEQLLGALDRQSLDRVRRPAALVVAPARIALGIFVGQHRALRLEHRPADDILRRDQLDLVLLARRARRGSRRRPPGRRRQAAG